MYIALASVFVTHLLTCTHLHHIERFPGVDAMCALTLSYSLAQRRAPLQEDVLCAHSQITPAPLRLYICF
jgi:hypothetical protein